MWPQRCVNTDYRLADASTEKKRLCEPHTARRKSKCPQLREGPAHHNYRKAHAARETRHSRKPGKFWEIRIKTLWWCRWGKFSPQLTSNATVKTESFPLGWEQDKDAHSCHFYSTQYWKSQLERSGKKQNWKAFKLERKKRDYRFAGDIIAHSKPQTPKEHQNTWVQRICRMQNQYTKIYCISK